MSQNKQYFLPFFTLGSVVPEAVWQLLLESVRYTMDGISAADIRNFDDYVPQIGANDNWFVNNIDTGVSAQGAGVVLYRVGNKIHWRNLSDAAGPVIFDLAELHVTAYTRDQRLAATGLSNGSRVFQTDHAKGEYQLIGSAWFFIGNKTTKAITSQAYTLTLDDIGYNLEFTLDIPAVEVVVTIPSGVFSDGHIVDIVQMGASKVKFVNAAGVTINSSSIYPYKRTFTQYSEAKLRFKSGTSCVLMGGLE